MPAVFEIKKGSSCLLLTEWQPLPLFGYLFSLCFIDPEGKFVTCQDPSSKLRYILQDARFFLIKSNNHENVSLAKAKVSVCWRPSVWVTDASKMRRFTVSSCVVQGVWSTLPVNEKKLNAAFRSARSVILVFSVRESGKFQGAFPTLLETFICGMVQRFKRVPLGLTCRFCTFGIGVSARRISDPLGSSCWHERQDAGRSLQDRLALQVDINMRLLVFVLFIVHKKTLFLPRRELPFTKTAHLSNPWNEHKPVKIGRDGQVC